MVEYVKFGDLDCVRISTEKIELIASLSVGPRILSYSLVGRENVFAELPELTVSSGIGDYFFRGGHRLWHAPEAMPLSYVPDNEPVDVEELDGEVRLVQPVERLTGFQKQLVIQVVPGTTSVTIDHVLTNTGSTNTTRSPWAITMLPLGGLAFLPLSSGSNDGLQPAQHLVLWPYSKLNDSRLRYLDSALVVEGAAGQRSKVGFANYAGWMAYWRPGSIFVKQAKVQPEVPYPDWNCTSECFVNEYFLELETLAPIRELGAGQSALHQERWSLAVAPLDLSLEEEALSQQFRWIERDLLNGTR